MTPEENEARQERRAVKRQALRDAHVIARIATEIMRCEDLTIDEAVNEAAIILKRSIEAARRLHERT
jgi:hypothetical protein